MGLKKMFKKKDPTEQELVEEMQKVGISTRTTNGRQEKFGAFKQYAQERQGQKPGFAPVNPYANMGNNLGNPYAQGGAQSASQTNGNPYGGNGNPYGSNDGSQAGAVNPSLRDSSTSGASSNPYGVSKGSSRTGASSSGSGGSPYGTTNSTYASGRSASSRPRAENPYGNVRTSRQSTEQGYGRKAGDEELTLDLNDIPSTAPPVSYRRPPQSSQDNATLDLNDLPEEDDLNVDVDDFLPEQEQVNSEDEEIEAIKGEIRFVKKESVQLTRNTLRMAQEADVSGTNTLGMLGSQSERLYNAEQTLLLADTQTKIADEKVKELKRLNRSIFVPATGNPFNKKSRLRQQELKLKTEKEQEKYLRETNRQGMYASEQRIKQGFTNNATSSDTHNKYQNEKYLLQAQRYKFEDDSEDDELEKEIGSNLDQIATFLKKLKSTAQVMGQEVNAQNDRLRKIEEDADRLDINVHLNSSRLNNIR